MSSKVCSHFQALRSFAVWKSGGEGLGTELKLGPDS